MSKNTQNTAIIFFTAKIHFEKTSNLEELNSKNPFLKPCAFQFSFHNHITCTLHITSSGYSVEATQGGRPRRQAGGPRGEPRSTGRAKQRDSSFSINFSVARLLFVRIFKWFFFGFDCFYGLNWIKDFDFLNVTFF